LRGHTRLLVPLLAIFVVLACDEGFDFWVENESTATYFLSLVPTPADAASPTLVFVIPSRTEGLAYASLGHWAGRLELLTPDCAVVATLTAPSQGATIRIARDGTVALLPRANAFAARPSLTVSADNQLAQVTACGGAAP
jgi:hypothetical protein